MQSNAFFMIFYAYTTLYLFVILYIFYKWDYHLLNKIIFQSYTLSNGRRIIKALIFNNKNNNTSFEPINILFRYPRHSFLHKLLHEMIAQFLPFAFHNTYNQYKNHRIFCRIYKIFWVPASQSELDQELIILIIIHKTHIISLMDRSYFHNFDIISFFIRPRLF